MLLVGTALFFGAPAAPDPLQVLATVPSDTAHVVIRGANFDPIEVRVPAGGTVVWTNADPLIHTVTAADGDWGSPTLVMQAGFARRFDEPGRYPYLCAPHPHMTGVVIVEASDR
jgi:plastocyanin